MGDEAEDLKVLNAVHGVFHLYRKGVLCSVQAIALSHVTSLTTHFLWLSHHYPAMLYS